MSTKYYGVFDAQGASQAFYTDDIYPPQQNGTRNAAIPAAAVEITQADWTALLADQQTARYVNGAVTHIAPPPAPPPPPPAPQDAVLFNHENRLRAIEGQPPLTLAEFHGD
jgi:hypothetical protein